jgi:hypothetical protein
MKEQLTAQTRGKRNKENLRRTVDVLAVATTLINQGSRKCEVFRCLLPVRRRQVIQ